MQDYFNPYDIEYDKLDNEIIKNKRRIYEIKLILTNNEKNKIELPKKLTKLENEKIERINNIDKEYNDKKLLLSELETILKKEQDSIIPLQKGAGAIGALGMGLSFLFDKYAKAAALAIGAIGAGIAFFSENEKEKLNNKISELKNEQKKIIEEREIYLKSFDKEKNELIDQIEKNNSLDLIALKNEIDILYENIRECENKLDEIRPKKDDIDRFIKGSINELNELKGKLSVCKNNLKIANDYLYRLNLSLNKYEKRKIHIECKNDFGESSPLKVIRKIESEIESIQRDIRKLCERIKQKVDMKTRVIREILIDGNNLCYANGSHKIGLYAIISLVKEINHKFKNIKITLFFDDSISKIVHKDKNEIENIFYSMGAVCKFYPEADSWITTQASESEFNYIISNDKFPDFHDKKAIKSKKVFKHLITHNTISVLDLDIENLKYTKQENI
ncbi:MAG: hypothetical protein SPE78_02525 [Actinobacillus minor]|nr:hypothetical protein [Actinobacillus minor]